MVNHLQGSGLSILKEGNHWALKECPLCHHKDCFKVTESMFQCFSCKSAGDKFKFESLLKGISYQEAKTTLEGGTVLLKGDEFVARKNHTTLFNSPELLKWPLEVRKISPQVLKQFQIGCYTHKEGQIIYTFPYYKDKEIPNTKFRTADKKLIFQKKDSDFYIYNFNVIKEAKEILIVEGELDVLAAYSYKLGIPTISFGLGASNLKEEWKELFEHIEKIYIAYDTDKVGKKGATSLAKMLSYEKSYLVSLPKKDMNDCLIAGITKEEIEASIHKALILPQTEIFEAIDAIEPNDQVLGAKLENVLNMVAERPKIEVEDYLKYIREKLPVTYQQIHDFRKQLKVIRRNNYIENKDEEEKVDLPQNIKDEALKFLNSSDILAELEKYLTEIGIVGESYNKTALWLFMLSRKLDKPIHAVVFGQSSSGKSELVKKVISTVPPEDVYEFTSMTARSLDYREDDLIGKVISISELNGTEEVEHTLRVAQSEGRLMRAYTIKDENTGNMRNVEKSIIIRSSFVITTTESSINNENNTRIFSLYADESIEQTKRISDFIKFAHTREYKMKSSHRERATDILRAAQTLIKNFEVVIPFASLLDFPASTTRNRRDLSRFLSFITVVTLLNQHKKKIKKDEFGEYIEADVEDYALAYKYLLPIIKNTLSDLSPRDELVLKVCALVQDDSTNNLIGEKAFTIKDIQTMAKKKNIDLKNSVNLRNELFELCEKDCLELTSGMFGKKGSRQKFKIAASYKLDEEGRIEIDSKEIMILTPDELKLKLSNVH